MNFIGRVTSAPSLKDALDVSTQRTRMIADRIAKASLGPDGGFQLPTTPSAPGSPEQGGVDVEAELTALADEQLRYEAATKVLSSTYAGLRSALRST